MKFVLKLTAIFSVVALLTFSNTIYADGTGDYATDTNILDGYYSMEWEGSDLYYDSYSGAVFFKHNESVSRSASRKISLPERKPLGMWFYIDIGNGDSVDVAGCTVEILDAEGNSLFSSKASGITDEHNYRRYSVGDEKEYIAVPDGAEKVVVTLLAEDKDGGELVDAYFRNIGLYFSDKVAVSVPSDDKPFMSSSGSLTTVEIGKTDYTYWIWVGIIFIVALIFYFVRMKRRKYKTATVMKPTLKK